MSTLIPVWQLSLGNSQQTTSESDKSDDKSDESESSTGETGTVKSPNTVVTVFLYIYDDEECKQHDTRVRFGLCR